MISSVTIAGLIVACLVCLVLPIGCLIYCTRKGKGSNLLLAGVMGMASTMLASSFTGMITTLKPVAALTKSAFLVYIIIGAMTICILETLARYFSIRYISKTGLGYYKGLAIGSGMAIGFVITQAANYFQLFRQAQLINNGTFISIITEQGQVTVEEAEAFIAQFASLPPSEYFIQALDRGVLVLLQLALTLIVLKAFLQKKTANSLLITAGIRGVYEFITILLYYISSEYMNYAINKTVSNILTVLFLLLIGAGCIFIIIKGKEWIPLDEKTEYKKKPLSKKENQEDKKAWQEIRKLNTNLANIDNKKEEQEERQKPNKGIMEQKENNLESEEKINSEADGETINKEKNNSELNGETINEEKNNSEADGEMIKEEKNDSGSED